MRGGAGHHGGDGAIKHSLHAGVVGPGVEEVQERPQRLPILRRPNFFDNAEEATGFSKSNVSRRAELNGRCTAGEVKPTLLQRRPHVSLIRKLGSALNKTTARLGRVSPWTETRLPGQFFGDRIFASPPYPAGPRTLHPAFSSRTSVHPPTPPPPLGQGLYTQPSPGGPATTPPTPLCRWAKNYTPSLLLADQRPPPLPPLIAPPLK